MPSLKTMRILNDIHTVFNESDFELRTNRKQREKNLDKLQICININGTATVVAPCSHGKGLYMTFEGYGRVDLWDGLRSSSFFIEENDYSSEQVFITQSKYSPEEIRRRFHKEMTDEWGLEFKNGEHQLYSPNWPGMLCSAKIIPQIYKVFQEDDFNLPRSSDPARLSLNKRFSGHVDPEGKLIIRAWIEDRWARRRADHIDIAFDGSDTVMVAKYPNNEGENFPIQEAREGLKNTYGVSFEMPSFPDLKETYERVQLDHFMLW